MGVVFDAPFGDNLDDLLALSLLYLLDSKNECRVASLTTSKENLASAGLYEVFQKLYGGRPTAIGMSTSGGRKQTGALLGAAVEGQAISVKSKIDTAEPHGLMRNVLQGYHDGNAAILSTGTGDNLKDLLALPTALPVVKSKVKVLYAADAPNGWPTPVVKLTEEMGAGLTYRPKVEDFAWTEKHPVALALAKEPEAKLNRAAMVAVLKLVRGAEFAVTDAVLQELVGAKPAPRQRMRGFG
jgi:hypothetical protein